MTDINSVAITLKSTNNTTPQANFSDQSFTCIAVTCADDACTSAAGQQDFTLKTTAAIGDPADSGVIASQDGDNGLIAPAADNSTSIAWGGFGTAIGVTAQSDTDGAGNTATIVTVLGDNEGTPYAAQLCNNLAPAGGYTDWFLPAKDQLNTLFGNKAAIGGFADDAYWSSTEVAGNQADAAWFEGFDVGFQGQSFKFSDFRVRCVRAF